MLFFLLFISNIFCTGLCNLHSHIPISITRHFKICPFQVKEIANPDNNSYHLLGIGPWELDLMLRALSVLIHVVSMTTLGSMFYYFHFTGNDFQSRDSY